MNYRSDLQFMLVNIKKIPAVFENVEPDFPPRASQGIVRDKDLI